MAFKKILFAGLALSLLPAQAFAHGGEDLTNANALDAWHFTPDIVIPTLLVLAVYVAGIWRRRHARKTTAPWRHAVFIAGVLGIFLSLQSPIDPIAERLFWVHQIQHMLLRLLGPLLICLAWPPGTLIAGLPRTVRRTVLAPLLSNGPLRAVFHILGTPAVATAVFIGTLYVWEWPAFHNAAVLNDGLHYFMHVTMLASGLLFWARIFDARPAPQGIRYGFRLMMLWITVLSNILLGALTTLKPMALYTAYDVHGRLFDMAAMADEQLGGVLIWIPSSMMGLFAVILVVHALGMHETKQEIKRQQWTPSNYDAMAWPSTGAELIRQARTKNRQMAFGFAGFSFAIFVAVLLIGVLSLTFHTQGPDQTGDRMLHASIPASTQAF